MKAIWSGSLDFGLVSIPIKLYTAVMEHSLGFTLLCGKCLTPIKYERFCSVCKKEIPWADVVKGIKLSDGKYFVITQEKLAKLKPEKTDSIAIAEFVNINEIPMIYFASHYCIVPSKEGEKSYFLFKKALEVTNKVAIGTFVMKEKQYVCSISSYDQALLLTTLHYDYEVRKLHKISVLAKAPKLSASELMLAKKLIMGLSKKTFEITHFKDEFAAKLLKAIKSGKSKKIAVSQEYRPMRKPSKEKTLLSTLKASLAEKQIIKKEKAKKKK